MPLYAYRWYNLFYADIFLHKYNQDRDRSMRKSALLFLMSTLVFQLSGQTVIDPLPYAPIAIQIPDTLDQLYRDSINLKFSPIRINQAGYRPQDD
jgi:hypothetical protein